MIFVMGFAGEDRLPRQFLQWPGGLGNELSESTSAGWGGFGEWNSECKSFFGGGC